MVRQIDVNICAACGELERLRCEEDWKSGKKTVLVGCGCGAAKPRRIEMATHEQFVFRVQVEKEDEPHDDPDPGDVQEG